MSKRHSRYRSGDIAESLGTVLLQGMSLVAPVPRTEDVGLDVVATLLEYVDSYSVKAKQSFYVQLKSAKTRSIEFEGDALKWLLNLELPFCIGSTNIAKGEIELLVCHQVIQAAIEDNTNTDKLVIHLDKDFKGANDAKVRELFAGPPAHSWTVANMADSKFVQSTYEILNPHLANYKRNLELARCGRFERLAWETGKPPYGGSISVITGNDSLEKVMYLTMPYLATCLQDFNGSGEETAYQLTLDLIKEMVRLKATKDPMVDAILELRKAKGK